MKKEILQLTAFFTNLLKETIPVIEDELKKITPGNLRSTKVTAPKVKALAQIQLIIKKLGEFKENASPDVISMIDAEITRWENLKEKIEDIVVLSRVSGAVSLILRDLERIKIKVDNTIKVGLPRIARGATYYASQ